MRAMFATVALLCTMVLLIGGVQAQDKGKEVTLKGTITCAKCDLGVEKKCATVIVFKEGDKTQVYYFDAANHKKYHGDTCTTPKDGSVTGTVTEKDGKKTITVNKLEYK